MRGLAKSAMYSDGERGEKHIEIDTRTVMQYLQVVESVPRAVSPLSPPPRKRRLIRSVSDESPYDEQSADVYASSSDSDDHSSEDCAPYTAPSVDAPNLSEFVLMTEDRDRVDFFRRQRRSSSLPAPPPALRKACPQHALQRSPQQSPHDSIHELQHEPLNELQQGSQRSPQHALQHSLQQSLHDSLQELQQGSQHSPNHSPQHDAENT